MNIITADDNNRYTYLNIALLQARESLMTYYRPSLKEAGITEQQWRIIRLLAERGTMDFQVLAESACLLRPSLTGILTRLSEAGLVIRLKPANDQRKVFVRLSEEGKQLFLKLHHQVRAKLDELEQHFPAAKVDELCKLLKELADLNKGHEEDM